MQKLAGAPVAKEFTLFWSNLEAYEKCPQYFLWNRGWGTIDCGGGPGKRKPKPVEDSRHHALMGIVIQKVIEDMYNNELWKTPVGLPERLADMVVREFNYEVANSYIDWRLSPSKAELLQVCQDGVRGFLRTMKAQRLLGPYARAEVELLGWVNKYTPIGGRADLIIRRDDTGVSILDGKNAKEKGKYTTPDQVRWYALCYYLAYGKLPDRVGFVYYRFPSGTPKADGSVEEGVDWIPVTRPDIEGLAKRAVDARKAMGKEKFAPTPSPQACKFCDYETVCEARKLQKAANSRGRKASSSDVTEGVEGFVDLKM